MVKPLKKQSPSASVSSIRSTEEIIDQLESVDISDTRADDNARFPECEGISRSAEPEGAWCVYWAPSNERDENNDCYIGPITYSDPTSYGCEPSDFLAALNETLSLGDDTYEFDGIDAGEALLLIKATDLGGERTECLYINGFYAEFEAGEITAWYQP
jgi:hypothetical protein